MISIATDQYMHKAIGVANGVGGQVVDEPKFIEWWGKMIRAGVATVFYREDSNHRLRESMGILCFDSPCTGQREAAISFWFCDFSEPPSLVKGILFARVIDYLKDQQFAYLYCNVNLDERKGVVSSFLVGNGFRATDVQFKKKLCQ